MKPVFIIAETLAEGWEEAVIRTWEEGDLIPTDYDSVSDPNSRDVTLMLQVNDPFAEPRIHMGGLCMGWEGLEEYRAEVLYGINDYRVGKDWHYSYNDRLTRYPSALGPVNQIESVVATLTASACSRRAQMITWVPRLDAAAAEPPCLQRMWFRMLNGDLHMNMHIRSNDAYKAGFPNMWAFTELQHSIAERLNVGVGCYTHIADSFHIYGSYNEEFQRFLASCEVREDRMVTTASVAEELNYFNKRNVDWVPVLRNRIHELEGMVIREND